MVTWRFENESKFLSATVQVTPKIVFFCLHDKVHPLRTATGHQETAENEDEEAAEGKIIVGRFSEKDLKLTFANHTAHCTGVRHLSQLGSTLQLCTVGQCTQSVR